MNRGDKPTFHLSLSKTTFSMYQHNYNLLEILNNIIDNLTNIIIIIIKCNNLLLSILLWIITNYNIIDKYYY